MAATEETITLARFAFRHIPTGKLIRISRRHNDDGDCCGEYRHELELDGDYPIYTRTSVYKLERVLAQNTKWYNADYRSPMHGSVKPDDLEIIRYDVTTTIIIEPVAFNRLLTLTCMNTERKTQRLAERYAGRALTEEANTLRTFLLPDGKTLEDMKRFEGSLVKTQNDNFVRIFAVFQAPEEYELDFKGKPGFCAITGETQYLG